MGWRLPWLGGFIQNIKDNWKNGYQFGDLTKAYYGFHDDVPSSGNSAADVITDTFNDHGLDENGNIEINPSDPTSSAQNVINYDPNKSAQENLLGYAQANNSASAYSQYLANQYATEMSNSALSRAIADAEANGISKYQLFQSGNMAASTPSSGSSMYQSYENAMNRRESWNEKELNAIVKIITATINSAASVIKKL